MKTTCEYLDNGIWKPLKVTYSDFSRVTWEFDPKDFKETKWYEYRITNWNGMGELKATMKG